MRKERESILGALGYCAKLQNIRVLMTIWQQFSYEAGKQPFWQTGEVAQQYDI